MNKFYVFIISNLHIFLRILFSKRIQVGDIFTLRLELLSDEDRRLEYFS